MHVFKFLAATLFATAVAAHPLVARQNSPPAMIENLKFIIARQVEALEIATPEEAAVIIETFSDALIAEINTHLIVAEDAESEEESA